MTRSISKGIVTWSAGGATCGNITGQTVGWTLRTDGSIEVVAFSTGITCCGGGANITASDTVDAATACWTL